MEAGQSCISVKPVGKDLEISNGLILLKLLLRDGGYAQEFYAADAKGEYRFLLSSIHKDLLLASEHRALSSPMIAGERDHLFAVCRESLRMVYSSADVNYLDPTRVIVRLTGSAQGHSIACCITMEAGSSLAKIEVEDIITSRRPVLEYLMSSYAFLPDGRLMAANEEPDYTWTPNLRPMNDSIIGDCAMHSPAAIVQHGRLAVALMPDMDMLNADRPMPAALDLDLNNGLLFAPLLSYGFCGYERTEDSSQFRHDITMSRRLSANRLVYGYSLLLDANCKSKFAYREVARLLWAKYGDKLPEVTHQPTALNLQSIAPDARVAYGLHMKGKRTVNNNLMDCAREITNALVASIGENAFFSSDSQFYSTPECSMQFYWLLKLNNELGKDTEVISLARKYADFLMETRLRSGAIPSWYAGDFAPATALKSNAQTAASVMFFAELARATGYRKYARACEQPAKFVLNEIIPGRLYLDHTCLGPEDTVSLECADPHSGMHIQSSQAMLWIAQMCVELHSLLEDRTYLEHGQEVLDSLCLYQAVVGKQWEPEAGSFGMLGRGNMGSRPDPELTAEFARCAMQYGAATGRKEYFERGVAALIAALNAEVNDESRARIIASDQAIRTQFGSVYVSLSGKWSSAVSDYHVRSLDLGRGTINIDLSGHPNGNGAGKVVFGGGRGSIYKVSINGQLITCTRRDLELGLPIPISPEPDPTLETTQRSLFG